MYCWSSIVQEFRKNITPKNPNGGIEYLLQKKKFLLEKLSQKTKRNTILYFSAFLHKSHGEASINDKDINAFMENVHRLDKKNGLDLILHTPGGDLTATEQIITYLHSSFDGNIRAIIPQMAMSAGSMIAVSCPQIIMGKQSCLGPFDPQMNGVPCQSVVSEFYKAAKDIQENPATLGLWQSIISKLTPTFITLCQQADELGEELTDTILEKGNFDKETKKKIKNLFSKTSVSKTHGRHINKDRCKEAGLHIIDLEDDQTLQDLVLGIHHCCMILSEQSNLLKVVENNIGGEYTIHSPQNSQQ